MKTEGRNAVLELLKTDKTIEKIMLEKGAQGTLGKIFAEARKRGVRVQFVAKEALDRESREKRHQGVIAFTTDYEYADLYDILSEEENSLSRASFIAVRSCFISPFIIFSGSRELFTCASPRIARCFACWQEQLRLGRRKAVSTIPRGILRWWD